MEQGFFTISRKVADSWLYPSNEERKLTRFEAWLEIIRKAKFVCTKKIVSNKIIIIPRGYFDCTVSQLSETWKWNKRTVESFLQLLESDGMIKRYKVNPKSLKSCTLIKVNNYNALQPEIWEQCKSEYKTKCNLNCRLQKEKANPSATAKPPKNTAKKDVKKHKYGTLNNVKLSDEEFERLNSEYGENATKAAIEFLSLYKKEKGYKNKDDNLTLRRWVYKACGVTTKIDNTLNTNYGGF